MPKSSARKSRNKFARPVKRKSKAGPRGKAPFADGENLISELLNTGVQFHQQGNAEQAEILYRQVLELNSDQPHALHLIGVLHHQRGAHGEAIELIEKSLANMPGFADAELNLGAAYFAVGDFARAERHFRRGVELNPDSAQGHSNLATVLARLSRTEEAVKSYENACAADPDSPIYLKRFADLYLDRDRYTEAFGIFVRYLEYVPDDPEALCNAGLCLDRSHRFEEAVAYYERAYRLDPESPEIANNLAGTLLRMNRNDEASKYLDIALNADPDKWSHVANFAGAFVNRGDMDRAIVLYENLSENRPGDKIIRNSYGAVLGLAGRNLDSIRQFEKAVEIDPDYADAWNNLGSARLILSDGQGATAAFQEVVRIQPRHVAGHVNLTLTLYYQRNYDDALLYARATTLLDDYQPSHFQNANKVFRALCDFDTLAGLGDPFEIADGMGGMEFNAMFLELLSIAQTVEDIDRLHALHVKWGKQESEKAALNPLPPVPLRVAGKKPRIALLSSDLRAHSVAKFAYPVIEGYDRASCEFYCYTPYEVEGDPMQARIKGMVDGFREVGNRSMREIAECIRDDGIDILFELNGYTKDSKLSALRYRPAPVQAYWLGYPYTTGLEQVDHIVLDPWFRPENDDWLVEEPLILPETWVCFDGDTGMPVNEEMPFERNGMVTFGTLNNPYKFTPEAIAAWARVMHGVPGSRFLLVRGECSSMFLCNNLAREFAKHGIGAERIYFANNIINELPHMTFYDDIDISLDTFPLTGGTTTCDALWMGVPVISLVGPCTHQRMGYSVLNNVGAGELCAFSVDEFVEKGIALGNDRESIREYRLGLRQAMSLSPLCDSERYVKNFQKMLNGLIERHELG